MGQSPSFKVLDIVLEAQAENALDDRQLGLSRRWLKKAKADSRMIVKISGNRLCILGYGS